MSEFLKRPIFDVLWFLFVVLVSSIACLEAGTRVGATWDEPFYLDHGLNYWRGKSGERSALLTAGTMPLPIDVQTYPLHLMEIREGRNYQPYLELPKLLPIARASTLLFWWMLLFYGMLFARKLGGVWAGRLAVALLACEPNLLAHAALATTDIACTGTILCAAYHWYFNRQSRWALRILVPGAAYGLALSAKASSFAYVPIIFAVLGLVHLANTTDLGPLRTGKFGERFRFLWTATRRLRWDGFFALWIGFILAMLYCGTDWLHEKSFDEWAKSLPDGTLKQVMTTASDRLAIFSNGFEAIVQQIKHNFRGHDGTTLLGQWHRRPVWFYFLVVLSAKLPIGILALTAFSLLFRPRQFFNPAGWVALALFLFTFNCRVQIGIRLVFPLIAFMVIAASVACWGRSPSRRHQGKQTGETPVPPEGDSSRLGRIVALLALAATLYSSMTVWPNGIRYTNELWGGTTRSPEMYGDSNFDWGQGYPELNAWRIEHGEPPMHVWYWGADFTFILPPFHYLPIHEPIYKERTFETMTNIVGSDYLAVSKVFVIYCPLQNDDVIGPNMLAICAKLRSLTPVGETPTFYIYKLK